MAQGLDFFQMPRLIVMARQVQQAKPLLFTEIVQTNRLSMAEKKRLIVDMAKNLGEESPAKQILFAHLGIVIEGHKNQLNINFLERTVAGVSIDNIRVCLKLTENFPHAAESLLYQLMNHDRELFQRLLTYPKEIQIRLLTLVEWRQSRKAQELCKMYPPSSDEKQTKEMLQLIDRAYSRYVKPTHSKVAPPLDEKAIRLGKLQFLSERTSLSMDQLLSKDPNEIELLFEKEWKEIFADERQIASTKEANRKINRELIEEGVVNLKVAKCLLTKSGNINVALIPKVREEEFYQKALQVGSSFGLHLKRVLDLFEHNVEFSAKLSEAKKPRSEKLASTQLLKRLFAFPEDRELTHFDAQLALLWALLTRPRQSEEVGSCFGTSVLLQAYSSDETLLTCLEDSATIIEEGKITREIEQEGIRVKRDFPMLLLPVTETGVAFENPLLKTYEFLIASLSTVGVGLVIEKNLENFFAPFTLIDTKLWAIYSLERKPPIERKMLLKALKETFIDLASELFDPFRKRSAEEEGLGAWVLTDRETLAFIDTAQKYQEFYAKVAKEAHKRLLNAYPQESEFLNKVMREINQWFAPESENMDNFGGEALQIFSHSPKGVAAFCIGELGNRPDKVRENYYQYPPNVELRNTLDASDEENLRFILLHNARFSESDRKKFLNNPEELIAFEIPSHSCSFKPGPVLQEFQKGETPESLIQKIKESGKKARLELLSKESQSFIVESLAKKLEEKERPVFIGAMNTLLAREEEISVAEFSQVIMSQLAWIKGSLAKAYLLQEALELYLLETKELTQRKPFFLVIGDINWNGTGHNNILLCYGVNMVTGEIATYTIKQDGSKPRPYAAWWLVLHHTLK